MDGCADEDALSDYCSACSQFSSSDSACGVADVGDALLGDVVDMPSSVSGAAAADRPAAAAVTAVAVAPVTAAAAAAEHELSKPQTDTAGPVRHQKKKRASASKRFKAWLKKVLK
jgi:hypothetical protein